ncbi:MAG: DEAD/DEAH box helicase family protein [Burkholderiaceae bacterium]
MKLHFDATLPYQKTAIDAVTQIFAGQPLAESGFSVSLTTSVMGMAQNDLGLGNRYALDNGTAEGEARIDQWLYANTRKVQEANNIPMQDILQGRHFSIEMETGTGKTYVYLRSIFELNKLYGFTKFIIVVPSVPIREGALASIAAMREHFTGLYGVPFDAVLYDSKNLSKVRQFASANTIQIMVMNIQSFQKDVKDDEDIAAMTAVQLKKLNVINRESDFLSGRKPIEFIQTTHPIVIIDEPQSVEGDTRENATLSSRAILRLNPLCTLRYSATHRNPHNLLYKLDPIAAYDQRLVKRIEVACARADENFNGAFVELLEVDNKKSLRAHIRINVAVSSATGTKIKQKAIWVTAGKDLWDLSKYRQEYRDGYIIQSINFEAGAESVRFSSGISVKRGAALGGMDDDLLKLQIRATVELHLKKEKEVRGKGIKVLSLFFIDVVANYRVYHDKDHDGGATSLGKLGLWFEEAYTELANSDEYKGLLTDPVAKVHNGYFSKDKKGGYKDTKGDTKDDEDTYSLIMRDKERLLNLNEPLRFIFSHTALREGWDNPNVFQICVLREVGSETERRQTIGRGLRLPVDQNGDRVHDDNINRLTVIARESYEQFAENLQKEYEDDLGIKFGVVPFEAFAKLVEIRTDECDQNGAETTIGQVRAKVLHQHLQQQGYLDAGGVIQPKFDPSYPHFELQVPPEFILLREQVVDVMQSFVFKNRIGNVRNRGPVKLRKSVLLDPTFKELWSRISQHTRYRVNFSTEQLIIDAAQRIRDLPVILPLQMSLERVAVQMTVAGIHTSGVMQSSVTYANAPSQLPDILAYLQNETDLTRSTLVNILQESGRLNDFKVNPQAFITQAASQINQTLHELMLHGIEYLKIAGQHWEMHQLEEPAEQQLERYLDNLYKVTHQAKALYDYVEYDSEGEKKFARELDDDERVKFFVKLPRWFKVDTPVGPYNPDWAIVFENDSRLYLVRETKSTLDKRKLRDEEKDKIACGRKHFAAIGVNYDVVTGMKDVLCNLAAPV